MLADERVDPCLSDHDGFTPLMTAGQKGHLHVVEALLKAEGIAVNQLTTDKGSSALMLMSQNGHADCVRVMLADERVDPCLSNDRGGDALILAAHQNRAAVVDMLLADGRVDTNEVN